MDRGRPARFAVIYDNIMENENPQSEIPNPQSHQSAMETKQFSNKQLLAGAGLFSVGLTFGLAGIFLFALGVITGAAISPQHPQAAPPLLNCPQLAATPAPAEAPPEDQNNYQMSVIRDPVWDSEGGIHVVATVKEIQPFPEVYGDFSPVITYRDAKGDPFTMRGKIRLTKVGEDEWNDVLIGLKEEDSKSKEACSKKMWMMRWTALGGNVEVQAAKLSIPEDEIIAPTVAGPSGYTVGSACDRPLMRFYNSVGDPRPTSVIVSYEVMQWEAGL